MSGFLYDLLDVAYTTEYGLDISEQSCLNLLYLIGTDPTLLANSKLAVQWARA